MHSKPYKLRHGTAEWQQQDYQKFWGEPHTFGHFLAGLIDADGYLRYKELTLTCHQNDVALAKMLQQRFGGRVRTYKHRCAVNYELNNVHGLKLVADLIRHRLRLSKRVDQYNTAFAPSLNVPGTTLDRDNILENAWLCGLTAGDGSFQIKKKLKKN